MRASVPAELQDGRSCLLITGAPGAGKSTVSRLVAESLSRTACLDGDFVTRLVVSGRVWALGEPADEAARQVRLTNQNLCSLADNFCGAGITPVIDSIVPDRSQLDFFREELAGRRLLLVVLWPSAATCRERNATRPAADQFFFDGYDELMSTMRTGFGELGWWFDTTGLTPAQTSQQVLARAPTLARRGL